MKPRPVQHRVQHKDRGCLYRIQRTTEVTAGQIERPLSVMRAPLVVARVEVPDALDDGGDLVVHERRLAADTIPAQQDLRHHRRVHPVPEEMPGQEGDRWTPPAIAKS